VAKVSRKKTLVLLDSHAILHRSFHALPNLTSPDGQPTGALYGFSLILLKIIKELKPDYIAACYDLPEPTFRHLLYKEYKAKRPKLATELALQIKRSKEILSAFEVPVYEISGFEADDLLASIVEKLKDRSDLELVIVSGDLDTLQLVGKNVKVYTMRKGVKETSFYDERAVKKRYGFSPEFLPDFKALVGDPSDNIVGVSGIGEKTAVFLIQKFGPIENIYKILKKNRAKMEKAGIKTRLIKILEQGEEEAYFSKTLATARKDAPINFSLPRSSYTLDPNKKKAIGKIFSKLGFRSLLKRIDDLNSSAFSGKRKEKVKVINGKKAEELKVAFWLLDSRRINPSLDEIVSFFGASSFEKIEEELIAQLRKDRLLKLFFEIEKPLISVLEKMKKRGILLDTSYLKQLSKDYHHRLDELKEKIWQLAGVSFNLNSPKQLSEVLFKKLKINSSGIRKTGQGMFSTSFDELSKIKESHPVVQELFLYRELAKLVSTYIDALPELVDQENRLHTHFHQTGTTTGRLSSSEPNLQNIPTRTEFGKAVRKAFIASPGFSLLSLDYSQMELRVAAFLSGDEKLKAAFLKNEDIHKRVAAEVFNVPLSMVTSEMRRRAKVINFGIIYGMGINSLKKNLGCTKEEAESFCKEYFNDFSGIARYIEKVKTEARKNGYAETIFGRRRYLPEINSSVGFIRREAERMAVNACIQGTATADIIKTAMVKIDQFLEAKKLSKEVKMLLQVHDELLFEVKNDILEKAAILIKAVAESSVLIDVPLLTDVKAGPNWLDLEAVMV
jgi:DNA polymerase-1